MAAKVSFDGPNRVIHILPGVTEIDVMVDLYSAWKIWRLESAENAGYEPAFYPSVGGFAISGTQSSPLFFFLINDWTVHIDTGETVTIGTNLYSLSAAPTVVICSSNSQAIFNNSSAVIITVGGGIDYSSQLNAIKAKTDKLEFEGADVKATLDGEEVKTDKESREKSKADIAPLL